MAQRAHQKRLTEFGPDGLPPTPRVIIDVNADTVHAPTGNGKVAGHIGIDKHRGGNAYVAYKERTTHYYRKGGGYALSKKILFYLTKNDVHTLYWVEDGETTYEFGIRQYVEESDRVQHAAGGDPQVYVPNADARHIWHDHNALWDTRTPTQA